MRIPKGIPNRNTSLVLNYVLLPMLLPLTPGTLDRSSDFFFFFFFQPSRVDWAYTTVLPVTREEKTQRNMR